MELPHSYRAPWSLEAIIVGNGALAALGICFDALDADGARLHLTMHAEHLNAEGRIHGGVLATLLDAACGFSARFEGCDRALVPAVTLNLSVQFVDAAQGDLLRAQGRVTGGGRRILFTQGEVLDGDGRLVASATGVFKRHRPTAPF